MARITLSSKRTLATTPTDTRVTRNPQRQAKNRFRPRRISRIPESARPADVNKTTSLSSRTPARLIKGRGMPAKKQVANAERYPHPYAATVHITRPWVGVTGAIQDDF